MPHKRFLDAIIVCLVGETPNLMRLGIVVMRGSMTIHDYGHE